MVAIRVAKRVPNSCYDCYKRRVKCNKQIPCDVCIRRGTPDTCHKEKVIVNGKLFNEDTESQNYQEKIEFENEYLRKENAFLISKLKEQESDKTYKEELKQKPNEYAFFGRSLNLLRYNKESVLDLAYTFDDFLELDKILSFDVSKQLIEFNFKNIAFFHAVLIPEIFEKEHDKFFKTDGKHINGIIEKTKEEYLWLAIYYALIGNSFLFLDEELMACIGKNETECNVLGKVAFSASMECLHRGMFLQCPDIKTLQVFCVLASSPSVLRLHGQNSLLACMIYIARTLNLDKLTEPTETLDLLNFQISCRIWWLLVAVDWFEDSSRQSCIDFDGFLTPKPKNITDFNLINNIDEETSEFIPITYNLYIYELSSIKRKYGISSEVFSRPQKLENLEFAYYSLLQIQKRVEAHDPASFVTGVERYARFLLDCKFHYESLVLTRETLYYKHANNLDYEVEMERCTIKSQQLIELINNRNYPHFYKKLWLVTNHGANGAVFLLLQLLLDEKFISMKTVKMIDNLVLLLQKCNHGPDSPLNSYIRIIKSLLEMIERKVKKQTFLLEVNEINNILSQLGEFRSIYDTQPVSFKSLLNDNYMYWDEVVQWITGELSEGNN